MVTFGPFWLDERAGELRKEGLRVRLQEQPLRILALLLEHPGEVVTRDELKRELWPADTFVDFDHSLNEAVNKLRAALGDTPDAPRFIETIPRRGYRFIAAIEIGNDAEPSRIPLMGVAPAAPLAQAHRPARLLPVLLLTMAAVSVAFVVLARWRQTSNAVAPKVPSLAVLPLENLSRDPEQDYFADGITDELITDLARLRNLRVISRTSVMKYKGQRKSAPEIGRDLNVDLLIDGSVLWSGNRVRITAQLIRAATHQSLWTGTYEREMPDILALQSEVAMAIARNIQVELTPQEEAQLTRARTLDPEVYQLYLRGRYYWNKRTEDGARKGIEYFQQAIAKDRTYAAAYAGLADCHILLGVYNFSAPADVFPPARAAARRALEFDDLDAAAHAALAWVRFIYEWNWPAAEEEFRRAIAINPGYATAHQGYGVYLTSMLRTADAEAEFRRALMLDPLSIPINETLGWLWYTSRQYDQAIAQYNKTLELDPTYVHAHRYLGLIYLKLGSLDKGLAELNKAEAVTADNVEVQANLALAYALAGRRDEARKMLGILKGLSAKRWVSPRLIAACYAGFGDHDRAIAALEEAYKARAVNLVFLKTDPLFDSLRQDPRLQDIVRRIGLP